jgi:hypothetical protein
VRALFVHLVDDIHERSPIRIPGDDQDRFNSVCMTDQCEGIFYYLRIPYSDPNCIQRMEEQEEDIESIKRAIALNPILTPEERQVLSLTYRNAITSRRNAIQIVSTLTPTPGRAIGRLTDFQSIRRTELRQFCLDLIGVIDGFLLPVSDLSEPRLFYES